jgi:hypothetical protein
MSTIRLLTRPVALLGVLAAGVPVLGALLATPAAAFGFGFHGVAASPMFARRQTTPSPMMPANRGAVRFHQQHVPSTATVSTTTAAVRAMRAKSPASALAETRSGASKTTHISGSTCKKGSCLRSRITRIATGDAQPGGPSTAATQTSSFGQGGAAGGLRMEAPGGSGPGQLTAAGTPANTSVGGVRSLNDPGSNRSSTGGTSATRTETTPNATTQGSVKGNTTAPNTKPTTTLTAVTVCMTPAGSCPMERDVGTPCQCKDVQGNIYDGIIK